jgi:hypothetical protein
VTNQEEQVQKQGGQLTALTSQVSSLSEARAFAQSQASSSSTTKIIMERARSGDEGLYTAATARLAGIALAEIKAELLAKLELADTSVAIYRQIPDETVLRQISQANKHVTDFAPGKGATGQAFTSRQVIVVTGDAVHNADYGLSPDQQALFADTTIVGSAPLFAVDDLSRVVGVITCTSPTALPAGGEARIIELWTEVLPVYSPFFTAYLVTFGPEGS